METSNIKTAIIESFELPADTKISQACGTFTWRTPDLDAGETKWTLTETKDGWEIEKSKGGFCMARIERPSLEQALEGAFFS